jgi:hypothetical protein
MDLQLKYMEGGDLFFLAQTFAACRRALALATREPVASTGAFVEDQAGITEEQKCQLLSQLGSRRKIVVLGIAVGMEMSSGTWSEVELVWEVRKDRGKQELKGRLTKALSSRARAGSSRLLLQVKRRSRRGSSIQARLSIHELN